MGAADHTVEVWVDDTPASPANPLPVAPVAGGAGGITDAELRASPVKVDDDSTQAALVALQATIDDGVAVTGPLTDAQLRATAVPVDVADEGGTPTQAADITVDATAGGVVLIAANTNRTSALVQNTGTANMRVRYDGSNPAVATGIQLGPGDVLALRGPHCPRGVVKAIREGSTSTTAAVEETVAS